MRIKDRFEHFGGYERGEEIDGIRLDKNESPFDLPPGLKDEIFQELKDIPLNRYPPLGSSDLRKKIADHVGYPESNVVLGSGSDSLLPLIFGLFDSDQVVVSSPAFSMYSFYAKRRGLEVLDVPLDDDFEIRNMVEKIQKPSIVCICSPNSPTGNLQPRDKIIDILETENLVVLDEAYVDFSERSNLDLVDEYDNLIVLRTLSKAFGLAGARVGYAVGPPKIISHLNRMKSPFKINILSLRTAEKVLENEELIKKNIDKIVKERERIIGEFEEYAYPSETNFVLLDLDAYEYLRKRGILVRKMEGRLEGKIRVTVGKKEENDQLVSSLKKFIGDRIG